MNAGAKTAASHVLRRRHPGAKNPVVDAATPGARACARQSRAKPPSIPTIWWGIASWSDRSERSMSKSANSGGMTVLVHLTGPSEEATQPPPPLISHTSGSTTSEATTADTVSACVAASVCATVSTRRADTARRVRSAGCRLPAGTTSTSARHVRSIPNTLVGGGPAEQRPQHSLSTTPRREHSSTRFDP
eukprot:902072-Prymnesium_polylepis.1